MLQAILNCFKGKGGNSCDSERLSTRGRRESDPLSPELLEEFGKLLDHASTEKEVQDFLTLHFEIDPRMVYFVNGQNPLTRCVSNKNANLVRLLLHVYKCDINDTDRTESGMTPLHTAVKNCDYNMTTILLLEGANSNARTAWGRCTPLHWCASRNFVEGAKLLLANDADIQARDRKGLTPLQWSLFHNEVEVTSFLRNYMKVWQTISREARL